MVQEKGSDNLIFFGIDLWDWIQGTITRMGTKVSKDRWNSAWTRTYEALGGTSRTSGQKGCPMKAAYSLFYLGGLADTNRSLEKWSLSRIRSKLSKNGVYAVLALEILKENPRIRLSELWKEVKDRYENELVEKPASSNQGGVTIAFKLFHANKIRD